MRTLPQGPIAVKPFASAESGENIFRQDLVQIGPNQRAFCWNRPLSSVPPQPLGGLGIRTSDRPMPDRERRQMARDILRIERRAGKGGNRVRRPGAFPVLPKRSVVEVRPEWYY